MKEQLRLLKGIIQNPEDIALRRVHADWLYDHGDPDRAEFIHGQIDLGSMSRDDPRRLELYGRTIDLLQRHRHAWEAPVRGRGVHRVYFRRGFVEHVAATAAAFVRHGAAWVADTPLCGVELTEVAGKAGRLAACPQLAPIRGLTIADSRFGDADAEALVRSPNLTGLTQLSIVGTPGPSLDGTQVGDIGVAAVVAWPHFPHLTQLRVESAGSLGSRGIEALAGAPGGSRLRFLSLANTTMADLDAVVLAGAAGLQGLQCVSFWRGRIGSVGLAALLGSPHLRNLSHASFMSNLVTPEVMHALASAGLPPTLKFLHLDFNPLGGIDIDAVGGVLHSHPGLARMSLCGCHIPRPVQRELGRRFPDRLALDPVPDRRRRTSVSG
jgi:uncharacterized protein (TIGR02996 family)